MGPEYRCDSDLISTLQLKMTPEGCRATKGQERESLSDFMEQNLVCPDITGEGHLHGSFAWILLHLLLGFL